MYFIVFWLGFRNIEKIFRQDILSGNIEMYLLRPIGYVWQKVFVQIGQGFTTFVLALVLSVVLDTLIVGLPQMSQTLPVWIGSLLVIFFLSQILTCLIYVLCGLSGFWLGNSEPIYFVVSKLIMIFGGAWVPIAFFPKALQLFAEFSPFGASVALSYAMYPNFAERFPVSVLNLCAWIVIFGVLTAVISKRAMRKLSING